jgi:V/A-type H+-transporting ATPase subunit C
LGDEALIKYMKSAKLIAFGEQPLIAYIAAKEAEIISIRTIMSGRKADVPHEVLRERLREAYV